MNRVPETGLVAECSGPDIRFGNSSFSREGMRELIFAFSFS